eukprot:s7736_g1.t1
MLITGKFSMMVVIMAIKMRTVLLMRMLMAADDDKVAGDGDGNDDGDADDDEDADAADGLDLGNAAAGHIDDPALLSYQESEVKKAWDRLTVVEKDRDSAELALLKVSTAGLTSVGKAKKEIWPVP